MDEEKRKKLCEVLGEDFVKKLEEQIKSIEESIPTTQNHYGRYMSILSNGGNGKVMLANLLIILGANREGVVSALKCLS